MYNYILLKSFNEMKFKKSIIIYLPGFWEAYADVDKAKSHQVC